MSLLVRMLGLCFGASSAGLLLERPCKLRSVLRMPESLFPQLRSVYHIRLPFVNVESGFSSVAMRISALLHATEQFELHSKKNSKNITGVCVYKINSSDDARLLAGTISESQ
jgi:hypothetical protein